MFSCSSARTNTALILRPYGDASSSASEARQNSGSSGKERQEAVRKCTQHANDVVRAIKAWSSDYIAYASPFLGCSLVGPAAMHFLPHTPGSRGQGASIDRELVNLVIVQVAKYWPIGTTLLRKFAPCLLPVLAEATTDLIQALNKINTVPISSLTAREKDLAMRYAAILPGIDVKSRRKSFDNVPD